MDKVRAFLKVVYQQRFWVLSVVCVLVAAVCWQMAAGALDAEFTSNKTKIVSEFSSMDAIIKKTVHGNEAVNQREREEAVKIRAEVLNLWEKMYALQSDKVLKWPKSLGEEFLKDVENKKFRDPITNPDIQQIYREFAKDRFPALVEIVKAKKMAEGDLALGGVGGFDGGRGFDGGGAAAMPVDAFGNPIAMEKYIVQWLDQGAVRQKLIFANRPTSDEIWVTQEDLWVYETLLHVIAAANEANGASRPDNAAIRVIEALEVGQPAAFAGKVRGLVMLPAGVGVAAEGDPSAMGDGGRGMGTDGTGAPVDMAAMLLANRYIGPDGAPIVDGSTVTGEYRMLPVRMLLMMEQEAIPDILIECANAALPIEVKRVRINADKSGDGFDMTLATPGAAGMGTDGGGRGGFDGGGGRGFDGGGGGRGFDGGRGGGMMSATMVPGASNVGIATVEFQGIVYIYNPPDPAVLSVPGMEEPATDPTEIAAAGSAPAL
jgi:uncharacterized membrane protein YgcG